MSTTQIAQDPRQHDAGFSGHRGLTIVRGDGAYLYDDHGQRYLDATSMYGVASLGHAHPAISEALIDQSARLIACFASYGNDCRTLLQNRLAQLLAPLDQIFLCNSGTEAVEAAIKLARATTGRSDVVALTGAFHGRTLGALSATARSRHRDAFAPLVPGFAHVRPGDLEALDRALTEQVGLFLVEVVQGEGGVKPVDAEYLRAAAQLCRDRGVLFGVDEVQTGIGRTGRWFAYQHAELVPDLVCLAKGLAGGVPIGAVAFSGERVSLNGATHGSTFGGNPLSSAAALAVLNTVRDEALVERAASHGERTIALLEELLTGNSQVRAIRGLGLMIGIELKVSAVPLQQALQARGILALGAGPRVLRLLPPLITPWEELERLARIIAEELQ